MSRSASSDVEESMSGRTGEKQGSCSGMKQLVSCSRPLSEGVGMHLTRRSDGSFFVRDLVPNGSAAMSGQVQVRREGWGIVVDVKVTDRRFYNGDRRGASSWQEHGVCCLADNRRDWDAGED